jgi:putative nucleotidyltransferase with HDIG domain
MTSWSDITRATDAAILAWAYTTPWAAAMRTCQQDAEWHAEGDVWTHTRMVCAELTELKGWHDLPRADQLLLLFTALFHDCGKPATTALDPETGRLRSHRHSIVGAGIARRELRSLGCPLPIREHICALVRYHGRPPFLLERADPEQHVIWHSWLLRNRLLYLFALADTRGRHARDTNRTEDLLNLWHTTAADNQCLDAGYPFANDHARFLFYQDKLTSLHYVPREDHRCTVTLMAGIPASGKDTWLATHRPGLPTVSLDNLREEMDVTAAGNQGAVIQAAKERCRVHLRAGQDFAFNATNTTQSIRRRWLGLFAGYDARIEIIYLEPPLKLILQRNAKRPDPVPDRVIRNLLDKVEPPTLAEAHHCSILTGE